MKNQMGFYVQKKGKSKFLPLIFCSTDVLLLLFSFFVSKEIVFGNQVVSFVEKLSNATFCNILVFGCAFLWIFLSLKFDLYEIPRVFYRHRIISKNVYVLLVFVFLSGGLIFFITDYKFSRPFFIYFILTFTFLIICWRLFTFTMLRHYRSKGYNSCSIVLVGLNRNMLKLIDRIYLNPIYGFKISGLFTDAKVKKRLESYYRGTLEDVKEFLEKNSIDEIVISLPHYQSKLINDLFQYADNNMIRVRIIPEFSEYLSQTFTIDYVQNIPILKLRTEPLSSISYIILNRAFDLIFSLLIIVFVFSWLFPVIAIIIKLTSRGPVFFVQERTGQDGKIFKCLKFRSMRVNSESDKLQATKGDSRITPFGAIMRKTSIDELPQIINVLLNHMSLVGPRPHMLKHTEEYRVLVDKFMVRHFAKPGVTGWAQINGFRGETKYLKDMKNRAAADIWYVENWSFLLDLRIIVTTVWLMFFKSDENAF